jgi:hypothetical protein
MHEEGTALAASHKATDKKSEDARKQVVLSSSHNKLHTNGALLDGERMSDIAALEEEHQPKDWERLKIAIRTRIAVLVGLVAMAGWLLSRVSSKRQRIDAYGSDQDTNSAAAVALIRSQEVNHAVARGGDDQDLPTETARAVPISGIFKRREFLIFLVSVVLFHFGNAAMLPMAGGSGANC